MKTTLLTLALFVTATSASAQNPRPVRIDAGAVRLAPINTKIGFVGTHLGAKPDPRHGGFAKFTGLATVNAAGALESLRFDIVTASLWTKIPKLTGHLKSPDFFDVRQHPTATFRSTSVRPSQQQGMYVIQGKFTLLGVTKDFTMPATIGISRDGLTLVTSFMFDRTQFGMTYGQGKVHKNVSISVVIGEPTADR